MDTRGFTKMKHDAPFLKRALWETYNKKCIYCGIELMAKEVEIDHLWPSNPGEAFKSHDMIQLRGELEVMGFETETLENYVVACKDCNGAAKKGNRSLGVSNYRFYYFLTFRKRDKVLEKIKKYEREMENEVDGVNNVYECENSHFMDRNLLVTKRMTNTFDSSFYVWGKGHACIRAFIPLDYNKEMSCCISTEEMDKCSISYTLSHEDILKYMFAGIGATIEERPWCICYRPEKEGEDYCIALPNIRIDATYQEVKELSEIIDDLFDEYMLQESRIRDILGINVFESSSKNEVRIFDISKVLWDKVVDFSKQHFCNQEKSEWNIFHTNCSVKKIQLCMNDNDNRKPNTPYFSPGIIAQFLAKSREDNMISIYWVPGYGAREIYKMDNFDNEFKWKADYAHDWFIYKLIPYVLYLDLPLHKRIRYKGYMDEKFIRDYVYIENNVVSYKENLE